MIFWLAATAAFGWAVGRLLLFPAAYLYFAMPIWYPAPLQDLTVLAMHGLLRITGPPALFTGDVIHIPNGTFRIEEGCSGVHFMIVGLAVAALYGEKQRDPWRIRAWQLALMAALAVLANWVRVYTVIEAGYLTDMQSYLVRVSHYGFGWAVFAATLVVFFWLVTRFGPDTVPAAAPVVSFPPARPAPVSSCVTRARRNPRAAAGTERGRRKWRTLRRRLRARPAWIRRALARLTRRFPLFLDADICRSG